MLKEKNNQQYGCFKTISLFILGIVIILFGGLSLSKWLNTNARNKVDKNGVYVRAVVYRKDANSKGRTTWFRFYYRDKKIVASEGGRDPYDNFSIGDTIVLKIDTTEPTNTYSIYKEI